jgi:DHA1 family multidrug resistance protein-like MFS transporter
LNTPSDSPTGETAQEVASSNNLVNRLSLVVFFEWIGAGALLPLLPIYLKDRGGSTTLVGLTMASFFIAGLVFQYPAGRLADRFGKKPVLLGGLIAYGIASLAYLLPTNNYSFLVLRFAQGAAAGAVEVASLALMASAIPSARRGRAVSKIYSAQLSGTVIGPLLGAIVGIAHMGIIFVAVAALCFLAIIPVMTSSTIEAHDERDQVDGKLKRIAVNRALLGAMGAAIAFGLTVGAYEACWSLLLHSRGATTVEIGLSWTIFSLPYVFMVRAGGWFADHYDRRILAIGGLLVSMAFCVLWPFVASIALLMTLGFVEAVGSSTSLPSIQGILTQQRPPHELGRVQGLFATSQTAAIAVSASFAGALFGINRALPFLVAAGIGFVLLIIVGVLWTDVPGRVSELDRSSL